MESLCSEVESHYRHALQQAPHPPPEGGGSQGGDEKAFARTLKVCSLCFKMLHHLIKEFAEECLEECGPRVAEVVLILQRYNRGGGFHNRRCYILGFFLNSGILKTNKKISAKKLFELRFLEI